MPTYDYLCRKCGDKFEHFQSMSSPSLRTRPNCKIRNCNVERIISGGTGLIFKGSGFYLTDYKNRRTVLVYSNKIMTIKPNNPTIGLTSINNETITIKITKLPKKSIN